MALLTEISLVQGMLGIKQKLPRFVPWLLMGTPSRNNKYSPDLISNLHSAAGWLTKHGFADTKRTHKMQESVMEATTSERGFHRLFTKDMDSGVKS